MCLAQGPHYSDAGEPRTRRPLVSSQALNHWATALPGIILWQKVWQFMRFTQTTKRFEVCLIRIFFTFKLVVLQILEWTDLNG